MAFDFSKLNFFSRLDARARVLVLFGAVAGVILLIFLATRFFSNESGTTGPSKVASAPQNLQSVPGGQLTPEYYRALQQANTQSAQQAQISGGSAVPTLLNIGSQNAGTANCNIICSDQSANVKNDLDDWVKQGKLAPELANSLTQMANSNVPVSEFAAELDRLVKDGRLTPEQARQLLEQYKKQHSNALLQASAITMDELAKSGKLPIDIANQLLMAQKDGASLAGYGASLDQMVKDGKISAGTSQQLLAQYAKQRAREIINQSIASLKQMSRAGQITKDAETELTEYENRMVPIDTYAAKLNQFVKDGKMTPATAGKILDEFKGQKAAIGATGTVTQLLNDAEAAAYGELRDLLKAGKITQETATQLAGMIQQNVSMDDYLAAVDQMVKQGKLTPAISKLKIADYQAVKGLRELSQRLNGLQGNNAPGQAYADELKKSVQAGVLTPEQAVTIMKEYTAATTPVGAATPANLIGTSDFQKLQQNLQQNATPAAATANLGEGEFAAAQAQAEKDMEEARDSRIQDLMTAMSGQAQQLITAWQPVTMTHKSGTAELSKTNADGTTTTTTTSSSGISSGLVNAVTNTLIKAGTVIFAVLDTAVNSDYPDSPVMATIVDGKYKGGKLMGKIVTTKGVSGQLDRVSLNFTLMNMDAWDKSKAITAYGIDPDTARTVMASSVDYHYMMRYGAIMATSFLQGYAQALQSSGATTTSFLGGASATNASLSPAQKIAVGLGQIGTNLGAVTQNYTNRPPTVRVDSGVGLGILFMTDVTS
ncbi:MAG: TrbI/VirB10 family protein [Gammaproteobacteria bacterium]